MDNIYIVVEATDQIAQFMQHGGNDFLLKPFQQEQVCSRVNANAQLLDQFSELGRLNQQKNELLGMAAHDIRGPLGGCVYGCWNAQA